MTLKVMAENPPVAATCRHHWVIDSPRGPVSEGSCVRCGAHKQFVNSPADFPWEGDGVADLSDNPWKNARSDVTVPYDDE